jgi:hypothetical protein
MRREKEEEEKNCSGGRDACRYGASHEKEREAKLPPLPNRKRKHTPNENDTQTPGDLPSHPKRQRPSTHHMTTRRHAPLSADDAL